jgi:hypothetical protein
MAKPDARGVSAGLSALCMNPRHYTALLKFFRSSAFDIDTLYRKLIAVFLKVLPPKTAGGRVILIGDHIKIAKEGRRMPVIEKLLKKHRLRQHSWRCQRLILISVADTFAIE